MGEKEPTIRISERDGLFYVECKSFMVNENDLSKTGSSLYYSTCYFCCNKACEYNISYLSYARIMINRRDSSKCPMCKVGEIARGFKIIISELKEAGLLSEDYKIVCCECYEKM